MAQAARAQLDHPITTDILVRRADDFSVERGVGNYLALLDAVVTQSADRP